MHPSHSFKILQVLRRGGPLSRKDLATRIGLTPASVSLLTGSMLARGLLLEVGQEASQNRAGRRCSCEGRIVAGAQVALEPDHLDHDEAAADEAHRVR